ncbi:MAG: AbrB/MazE/SpoVT family DNA-binding domain-containing protein [Actinobacteria bacterium]|nr:AbrB/MazE/SpoVT family DNA-binding domain-containing protein [Actinomycetota bacterium]
MKAVVSEKGQITIPKALRDRLGIRPGMQVDFEERSGRLVGTKVVETNGVDSVYGMLKLERGTDDFLDSLRGEVLEGEVLEGEVLEGEVIEA